jgi:hypothetical protein
LRATAQLCETSLPADKALSITTLKRKFLTDFKLAKYLPFFYSNITEHSKNKGSIPDRGKNLYLLHSVQAGSGAHQASYPKETGGLFIPGGKVKGKIVPVLD